MATLRPVFLRNFTKSDGTVNLKIRLTQKQKTRYISTSFYVFPKFVTPEGRISNKHPSAGKLNIAINSLMNKYNEYLLDYGSDIENTTVEKLHNYILKKDRLGGSFTKYMEERIDYFRKVGRISYAELYRVTVKHMNDFSKGEDTMFTDITVTWLGAFEEYMRVHELKVNSRRIYLNNIRATYFHAMDSGAIKGDANPFRKFKIKQEKGSPRPLTLEEMRLLRERTTTPRREMAVDLFMLSFYLIGINFKDMLLLGEGALRDGRICFTRFKTERLYSIKVEPEAMALINKYRGRKLLLNPIERKETRKGREEEAHHDVTSNINKVLKKMMPGTDISTYSARYSWATYAAKIGISRDVIAHALGHGVNTMTDLYIDFGQDKVDEANRKVIDYLIVGK